MCCRSLQCNTADAFRSNGLCYVLISFSHWLVNQQVTCMLTLSQYKCQVQNVGTFFHTSGMTGSFLSHPEQHQSHMGCSSIVVTCLYCSEAVTWIESYHGCEFITTVTTIYSLGHGLCTLTAVPRSTQPSTLHGTVKWVSAYELSNNNKWRWCLRMVAANLSADSQPKSVGLVWGLVATRRSVCIHQMNRVNSRNDYVMMTAP